MHHPVTIRNMTTVERARFGYPIDAEALDYALECEYERAYDRGYEAGWNDAAPVTEDHHAQD